MGQNLAKPFWGWHDNRTIKQKILAVGQWGLDPADGVSRNLTFPPGQPVSLDYVFNPYLAISPAQPVSPVPGFTSLAPPVPLQPSTQAAGPRGWFEVRVWVDSSLEASISGEQAQLQAIGGTPHTEHLTSFSEPFPSTPLRALRVVTKEGRGHVQVIGEPSAQNDYTARLRIDDPQTGGAIYHVSLEWEQ